MQKFGSTIGLDPDRRQEYLALHRAVWPAVEARLRQSTTGFTMPNAEPMQL
jgi:L-rhamnose mutarotase